MPSVRVNGVALNYEERGSGFPMVWAHGLFGTLRDWHNQMEFFSNRFRVVAYDARGHGGSEAPEDPAQYSQDTSVEDLRQLLQALDIPRAYIGGLSMGGNIALNFAIQHPHMTRGFISADTGSGSTNAEEWRERTEAMASQIEEGGMAALMHDFLSGPAWRTLYERGQGIARHVEEEFLSQPVRGVANTIRQVQGKRPSVFALEPKLVQLRVPGLIIVGEKDEGCIEPSRFLAEKLPNADLVVIPGAGHNTHLETPSAFNRAVSEFIQKVEGEGGKA